MENLFSKEIIEQANQIVTEINCELDLDYCAENEISFPNNEVDMMSINLFTEESTDLAYDILHPKSK